MGPSFSPGAMTSPCPAPNGRSGLQTRGNWLAGIWCCNGRDTGRITRSMRTDSAPAGFRACSGCRLEVGLPYEADIGRCWKGAGRAAASHCWKRRGVGASFPGPPPPLPAIPPSQVVHSLLRSTRRVGAPDDMAALSALLRRLKAAAASAPLSISCFHSRNDPARSLVDLFDALPELSGVRLLVQDGSRGLRPSNYRLLDPALRLSAPLGGLSTSWWRCSISGTVMNWNRARSPPMRPPSRG